MAGIPPIKKNDEVFILGGKDRGKTGRVLIVLPKDQKIVVEGGQMIKRHTRPNPQRNIKGGIVEKEAPAHEPHFHYTYLMPAHHLEKIVSSMGYGEASVNAKTLHEAIKQLGRIYDQSPIATSAKKATENFKLRLNLSIGAAVTLSGER